MSIELKLKEEFPQIFNALYDPDVEGLEYGIECGDGWYDLIRGLCEQIMVTNPPPEFHALQVKEKFGELRFYVTYTISEIEKLIGVAENQSRFICESCGADGETMENKGCFLTICPECKEK